MKIGDLKIYFKNDELVFVDKEDKFLFSLGFSGDIYKLQEVLNNDPSKIKIYFSLFPFGFGIYDLSSQKTIGVLKIRLW
jgi:phage-related protein